MDRIEQAAAVVEAARALLADAGPDGLPSAPDSEIIELLTRTAALSRIVDGLRVRLAAEVEERSRGPVAQALDRRMGCRSAKEAIASAFGIRSRQALDLLSIAAATTPAVSMSGSDIEVSYPRVAAALQHGEVSLEQALAIVSTLAPAAPRADLQQLAWAEGALVDAATDAHAPLVPELLVTQARAYAALLDPDGLLPNAERQRSMRSLRLHQRPDGMWHLSMLSPPEAGSAIKALLDAMVGPRVQVAFRDDEADGVDARGGADPLDEVDPALDTRTHAQRQHDVLVGLVQAHAASGNAPTVGGEAPTLVISGTVEAYSAYLHGVQHQGLPLVIEHTGDLLPMHDVERLLCDADVHHVLVDDHFHTLRLGRSSRRFSRAQRRALANRDKGCTVRGCSIPAAWCEAHHVRWWEHGGPTDLDNGIMLCSYHHHEVHARRLHVVAAGPGPGRWRVVADQPRAWRTPTAAASASPAVTLPDAHPAPAAVAPSVRSSRAERHLRRSLGGAKPRASLTSAFDLHPPARIVLRI